MKITTKIFNFIKKNRDILGFFLALCVYFALAIIFSLPCPIKYTTGVSCPGCGMTRALISLVRLDFESALYYHPLVFLLPFAAALLCIFTAKKMFKTRRYFVYAAAALLIAVYLYRFLILKSEVLVFAPEESVFAKFYSRLFGL